MTRFPRRSLSLVAAAVVIAVASGCSQTIDRIPLSGSTPSTYDSGQVRHASVWVDGWSQRTLLNGALFHYADGERAELELTAATESEIQALAEQSPEVLNQIASRTISADSKVSCTSDGCTTSTGDTIPLEWFSHPHKVPGLGDSYRAWDVSSLVFHATVEVEDSTQVSTVYLGTDEGEPQPFYLPAPTPSQPTAEPDSSSPASTPRPDDSFDATSPEGSPSSDSPVSDLIVGVGMGRVFTLASPWLGDAKRMMPLSRASYKSKRVPVAEATFVDPPQGLAGLSQPVGAVATFDDQQMSSLTSPTLGCLAFTCTPGEVEAVVVETTATSVPICSTQEGTATKASVIVEDTSYAVVYPHPTVQFGLWNGASQDQFPGALNGDWVWRGTAPTVEGSQQVRMIRYWYTFSPDHPWQVAASVRQVGVDEIPADFDPAAAERIDALDSEWRVCQD